MNKEFGYNLIPSDFEGDSPKINEHELEWHFIYSSVFNDAEVREMATKHYAKFQRKGVFSVIYELGEAEAPAPEQEKG